MYPTLGNCNIHFLNFVVLTSRLILTLIDTKKQIRSNLICVMVTDESRNTDHSFKPVDLQIRDRHNNKKKKGNRNAVN